VEAALRRFPLEAQLPSGRPYLSLALLYALAGNAGRARALLDEYQVSELPEIRQGARRLASLAEGATALAEGRADDAVRLLRRADTEGCTTCALPLLGAALERAGRVPEARAVYDRYLTLSWPDRAVPWPSAAWDASGDALWRARVLERLARLDAAAGDVEAARRRVGQIDAFWSGGDRTLRRQVEELRRRLLTPS
jgi:tetratricopeptide (TPR) repeat protein